MAQTGGVPPETASLADTTHSTPASSIWSKIFGRANGAEPSIPTTNTSNGPPGTDVEDDVRRGITGRRPGKVVPRMNREFTLHRQQSELRDNLEPVQPTPAERRAVSMDRRMLAVQNSHRAFSNPRASAPDFLASSYDEPPPVPPIPSLPPSPFDEKMAAGFGDGHGLEHAFSGAPDGRDTLSQADTASVTTSQYDTVLRDELENVWILNLSMHFRDKSKREKFFVTYRERDALWRRVTISLDYRSAQDNSLEMDLQHTKFQRDKSAKIYEAIRESLADIQFYDTVTNLKLQTTDGRLHVHVVEDVNEIIPFPSTRTIQHMGCRRVKEQDIEFDSHMSGFVYKVRVDGETLIKKEIPGPETVDEFLYEINALNQLRHSHNVIRFYGVIVDDHEEHVKGLLISYADRGALIDVLYDGERRLPWPTREKWARQIVEGLSEIHEAGFVQGDFTLSNIVIDADDDAKIIDINRRGCPVGWEPPEATPLIETNQRISLYIGVKSDLFQLGMVLWALAMQEDEPEAHGRPLGFDGAAAVPRWYRVVVETCLADDPRVRAQAFSLLRMFPAPMEGHEEEEEEEEDYDDASSTPGYPPSISMEAGKEGRHPAHDYLVDGYDAAQQHPHPRIRTVQPPEDWSYVPSYSHTYVDPATGLSSEPYFYPTRGRSPPSPGPMLGGVGGHCEPHRISAWEGAACGIAPSMSDVMPDEDDEEEGRGRVRGRSVTPRVEKAAGPVHRAHGEEVHELVGRVVNAEQAEVEDRDGTPTAPVEEKPEYAREQEAPEDHEAEEDPGQEEVSIRSPETAAGGQHNEQASPSHEPVPNEGQPETGDASRAMDQIRQTGSSSPDHEAAGSGQVNAGRIAHPDATGPSIQLHGQGRNEDQPARREQEQHAYGQQQQQQQRTTQQALFEEAGTTAPARQDGSPAAPGATRHETAGDMPADRGAGEEAGEQAGPSPRGLKNGTTATLAERRMCNGVHGRQDILENTCDGLRGDQDVVDGVTSDAGTNGVTHGAETVPTEAAEVPHVQAGALTTSNAAPMGKPNDVQPTRLSAAAEAQATSDRRSPTARRGHYSSSLNDRGGPIFELPGILKGVGSAYDDAEVLPAQAALDEDFRALASPITTTDGDS